jgi:hypothetical protein
VPRIRDEYTHCAVYIYGSLLDAQIGERFGGSGFVAAVRPDPDQPEGGYAYIVTNAHVVRKCDHPVIRVNRKDGAAECIPTKKDQWYPHPNGDDVAVFPLTVEISDFALASLDLDMFVTPELIFHEDIGIGDDTIMVGRFINHDGRQKNSPAVRFGNIAMMDREKIHIEGTGFDQESFLVEVRSLPGYSGSAVLLYSPCAINDMSERREGRKKGEYPAGTTIVTPAFGDDNWMAPKGPFLLGIDFCHINRDAPVRIADGSKMREGWFVEENTGMAGVIPAWKIAEIINCEELKMLRGEYQDIPKEMQPKRGVSLDVEEKTASQDVFTKEEFEAALKKASRKVKG